LEEERAFVRVMIAIGDDTYPSLPISTLGTEERSAVVLDEVFRQFTKKKNQRRQESPCHFFLFNVEVNKNKKFK